MKIIIGIIIGVVIILSIKTVYAEKNWEIGRGSAKITKIQDGNINCYVASDEGGVQSYTYISAISCVRVE